MWLIPVSRAAFLTNGLSLTVCFWPLSLWCKHQHQPTYHDTLSLAVRAVTSVKGYVSLAETDAGGTVWVKAACCGAMLLTPTWVQDRGARVSGAWSM